MMAAQEYEGMKEQLDLEQNLRVQAETYAHEVSERPLDSADDHVVCSGLVSTNRMILGLTNQLLSS